LGRPCHDPHAAPAAGLGRRPTGPGAPRLERLRQPAGPDAGNRNPHAELTRDGTAEWRAERITVDAQRAAALAAALAAPEDSALLLGAATMIGLTFADQTVTLPPVREGRCE